MFSVLEPGGKIKPHMGPSRAAVRVHLGLKTPPPDQCYITVDGTKHGWVPGKLMMFDDTFVHEVANNSDQDRLVLFLDIERKNPDHKSFQKGLLLISDQVAKLKMKADSKSKG